MNAPATASAGRATLMSAARHPEPDDVPPRRRSLLVAERVDGANHGAVVARRHVHRDPERPPRGPAGAQEDRLTTAAALRKPTLGAHERALVPAHARERHV